jgi:hypothetical protein
MATYRISKGSITSGAEIIQIDPASTYSERVKKRLAKHRRARVFTNCRQINGEVWGTKAAMCIK